MADKSAGQQIFVQPMNRRSSRGWVKDVTSDLYCDDAIFSYRERDEVGTVFSLVPWFNRLKHLSRVLVIYNRFRGLSEISFVLLQ